MPPLMGPSASHGQYLAPHAIRYLAFTRSAGLEYPPEMAFETEMVRAGLRDRS
jgi:hypothetical protein